MKKILFISGLIFSNTVLAISESTDWMQQLQPQLDQHNTDERVINIIKDKSTWVWDTKTNKLAFCMKIPNRDMLCTNVPEKFTIKYNE